ncbi:MAG: hypothetical protein QM504_17240 [Pseudomonadota bacterium]
MYLIEKCVNKNVIARYSHKDKYLWINAWGGGKSIIKDCTFVEAIEQFNEKTLRVRSAPYRLREIDKNIVLASINTVDSKSFMKFTISSIGFNITDDSVKNISESNGMVVRGTLGFIVGACSGKSEVIKSEIDSIALKLSLVVESHNVIIRYNSSGESGGAWLETCPFDGLLSNSDIGITYKGNKEYKLIVVNKFLVDDSFGNFECSFTGLLDHSSIHKSIEGAIEKLQIITRKATAEELELLVA